MDRHRRPDVGEPQRIRRCRPAADATSTPTSMTWLTPASAASRRFSSGVSSLPCGGAVQVRVRIDDRHRLAGSGAGGRSTMLTDTSFRRQPREQGWRLVRRDCRAAAGPIDRPSRSAGRPDRRSTVPPIDSQIASAALGITGWYSTAIARSASATVYSTVASRSPLVRFLASSHGSCSVMYWLTASTYERTAAIPSAKRSAMNPASASWTTSVSRSCSVEVRVRLRARAGGPCRRSTCRSSPVSATPGCPDRWPVPRCTGRPCPPRRTNRPEPNAMARRK